MPPTRNNRMGVPEDGVYTEGFQDWREKRKAENEPSGGSNNRTAKRTRIQTPEGSDDEMAGGNYAGTSALPPVTIGRQDTLNNTRKRDKPIAGSSVAPGRLNVIKNAKKPPIPSADSNTLQRDKLVIYPGSLGAVYAKKTQNPPADSVPTSSGNKNKEKNVNGASSSTAPPSQLIGTLGEAMGDPTHSSQAAADSSPALATQASVDTLSELVQSLSSKVEQLEQGLHSKVDQLLSILTPGGGAPRTQKTGPPANAPINEFPSGSISISQSGTTPSEGTGENGDTEEERTGESSATPLIERDPLSSMPQSGTPPSEGTGENDKAIPSNRTVHSGAASTPILRATSTSIAERSTTASKKTGEKDDLTTATRAGAATPAIVRILPTTIPQGQTSPSEGTGEKNNVAATPIESVPPSSILQSGVLPVIVAEVKMEDSSTDVNESATLPIKRGRPAIIAKKRIASSKGTGENGNARAPKKNGAAAAPSIVRNAASPIPQIGAPPVIVAGDMEEDREEERTGSAAQPIKTAPSTSIARRQSTPLEGTGEKDEYPAIENNGETTSPVGKNPSTPIPQGGASPSITDHNYSAAAGITGTSTPAIHDNSSGSSSNSQGRILLSEGTGKKDDGTVADGSDREPNEFVPPGLGDSLRGAIVIDDAVQPMDESDDANRGDGGNAGEAQIVAQPVEDAAMEDANASTGPINGNPSASTSFPQGAAPPPISAEENDTASDDGDGRKAEEAQIVAQPVEDAAMEDANASTGPIDGIPSASSLIRQGAAPPPISAEENDTASDDDDANTIGNEVNPMNDGADAESRDDGENGETAIVAPAVVAAVEDSPPLGGKKIKCHHCDAIKKTRGRMRIHAYWKHQEYRLAELEEPLIRGHRIDLMEAADAEFTFDQYPELLGDPILITKDLAFKIEKPWHETARELSHLISIRTNQQFEAKLKPDDLEACKDYQARIVLAVHKNCPETDGENSILLRILKIAVFLGMKTNKLNNMEKFYRTLPVQAKADVELMLKKLKHPVIYRHIGSSIFFVYIDGFSIQCQSLTAAVFVLMCVYRLFNLKFPNGCKHVLGYFYKGIGIDCKVDKKVDRALALNAAAKQIEEEDDDEFSCI